MKKIVALFIALLAAVCLLVSCESGNGATEPVNTTTDTTTTVTTTTVTTTAVTTTDTGLSFSLRIEGNDACLYSGTVGFSEGQTLRDALSAFDAGNEEIAFTGLEADYITAINGEACGRFGGWDGWLFRINGADAMVAMSETALSDGDEVLFYYADPYGVGTEFPTFTVSGKTVTFTDGDKPVKDLKVTVGKSVYTTDVDGRITVSETGTNKIQIEKKAENGLTLVLRFAPDAAVTVN